MTAALEELVGRVLGGRYRIVAPIAAGASARVFLADDITLRRRVAVKVLHDSLAEDETFLKRFQAEAQAVGALNHPHILAVYDWSRGNPTYLVSELLGGGSLRALLDAGHRLTPSQALLVGLEATRGLEYAHKRGLVHRDIKPANLLFDDEGRLRIADFGLARALAEAAWTEPSGVMLGTMRYASPEQAKGQSLTGKSDIYSLALVLVEAVTGEVPFTSDTALGTLMARVDQQLHAPASLGPLVGAIERAAHPDAGSRPDAGEFAIALMAAAEELVRPEPLPLAGALPRGDRESVIEDPTLIAPSEILRRDASDSDASLPARARSGGRAPAVAPTGAMTAYVPPSDARGPRRWPILVALLLVAAIVGGGVLAVRQSDATHALTIGPSQPEAELVAQAERFGWLLDRQEGRDRAVPAGSIMSTDPPAGTKLKAGDRVVYLVSLGPPLVNLPPGLVGMAAAEARERLTQAGFLVGEVAEAFDEKVERGRVLRALDDTGKDVAGRAPEGATIALVASKGAQPRGVPAGLEGQAKDTVLAQLNGLRLVPKVTEEFSETVPPNAVIKVDPPAGTQLEVGSPVNVTVSKGPAPRKIPNVVGMTVAAATDALIKAGFEVSGVDGPPNSAVIATDPPVGEERPYKDKVRIITRRT